VSHREGRKRPPEAAFLAALKLKTPTIFPEHVRSHRGAANNRPSKVLTKQAASQHKPVQAVLSDRLLGGHKVVKWEYRTCNLSAEPGELDQHLDQFGEKGWELVSMEPIPHGYGGTVSVSGYLCAFKRPREE